ncbi:MAG: hypothetical protein NC248_03035 [Bacteroides sp.]|nr:hypothetical protein [Bacteroides sp.]MCM1388756.1 hypothetical protein [Bacteroides sp.]
MKAKVLKYKFDGNTVVAPYMELEAYAENVYLSLSEKDEYGNESEDIFHVVCKVENVYFSCGQYSRRILVKEGQKEKFVGYCKNWVTNTLQDAENGNHVSLLSIRVFEELGLDTAPLLQAREAYRKKQEQRRLEQKEQEEEKRRQEEAKWQKELDEGKQNFLNGNEITAAIFLEITKRDGFDIHIRTKGTFSRHVKGLDKSGCIWWSKKRGCRTPDFSGCHKAIADYMAFLKSVVEN